MIRPRITLMTLIRDKTITTDMSTATTTMNMITDIAITTGTATITMDTITDMTTAMASAWATIIIP